jgi:hypothetical protein
VFTKVKAMNSEYLHLACMVDDNGESWSVYGTCYLVQQQVPSAEMYSKSRYNYKHLREHSCLIEPLQVIPLLREISP